MPPKTRKQKDKSIIGNTKNKEIVYEWFYDQLKQLIKQTDLALNAKKGTIVYLGRIRLTDGVSDTNNQS